MNHSVLIAVIAAAGAAVSMGTIGLMARLSEVDSVTVTFYRLAFGALFLWLFLALTGQMKSALSKPTKTSILSGVFIAAFILFYIEAMQHTTILVAVITLYAAPPVASLVSHFFLNDKLSRAALLSVMIAIAGFILVIQGSGDEISHDTTGFLFSLASMSCYCLFILLNKFGKSAASEWSNTAWQLMTGSLILLPLVLLGDSNIQHSEQWLWMLLTGLIPGFLGLTLAVYAIRRLSSASYATISYLEPVTALILGWIVFSEHLNAQQMLGAIVIIVNSLFELYMSSKRLVPVTSPAVR
ncbi:putative membrane protein [Vibrio maritimus]|uniref:Putative membrane protein n=1 Tax=Vibrio maritimus TaxID=990268 RepID=A0A090RWD8_9VIBR|nr:putative membrane protein [Vibrio maritimus]